MSAAPTTLATTDSADVAHEQAVTILHGDCLDVLRGLAAESVDAIVCDPPYGLGDREPPMLDVLRAWLAGEEWTPSQGKGFMGKAWDAFVPGPAYWRACYRVLKPGGHLVAFGGTRTYDLISLAIRLAGFERRDTLAWLYGSGFPKSLDVSKAIDKLAGAERIGREWYDRYHDGLSRTPQEEPRQRLAIADGRNGNYRAIPATDAARAWDGWGTALKPAYEPIILARKPIAAGCSVAANVLRYGTGGVHVDACRVGMDTSRGNRYNGKPPGGVVFGGGYGKQDMWEATAGRWPPNLLLTHAPDCDAEAGTCAAGCCPVAALDAQSGERMPGYRKNSSRATGAFFGSIGEHDYGERGYPDTGTASRFFPGFYYAPKASRSERDAGCEALPRPEHDAHNLSSNACARCGLRIKANGSGARCTCGDARETVKLAPGRNVHPTVKPLALMRWLVRLVTPAGGVVLDPFAGSGTTGVACAEEGMRAVLIEREAEYVPIIAARVAHAERTTPPAAPPLVSMPRHAPVNAAPVRAMRRKRAHVPPAGQLELFAEAV